jgi:organic radical activating enzyme
VLSGGEPFLQAAALADLCARVRAIDPTAPVLTYTGFCLEELLTEGRPGYIDLLRQTDVLVDGPYLQEVPSSVALMGSGNQRVIFLGDRVDPRRMNNMAAAQVQASVGASGKLRLVGTGGVDMRRVVGALRKHGLEVKAPDAR